MQQIILIVLCAITLTCLYTMISKSIAEMKGIYKSLHDERDGDYVK